MPKSKKLKWGVRLLILAGALFFAIGGPLPAWLGRLIPALSPLTLLAESIAQRTVYAGLFWVLPPFLVLVLAVLKGRLFCQWLCPLGTLYSLPQKVSLKKRVLPVRLNALMFWMILSSSILGLPALLWLDPLSTFPRVGVLSWGPGLLIPLFLLLSFFQPQVWCTHICPLGYFFDLLNVKNTARVFKRDRRQFIAGLGVGGAAAVVLPTLGTPESPASVLPPGANGSFAGTCTRCYACVQTCPSGIIRVKKGGALIELAMPELVFDDAGCDPLCNQCSQVCPTGAIRHASLAEKQQIQLGVAAVCKGKCLAWGERKDCMLCFEVCPYDAIDFQPNGGIDCPVVIPELCRGCGACEAVCPVERRGRAIRIDAVCPQRMCDF